MSLEVFTEYEPETHFGASLDSNPVPLMSEASTSITAPLGPHPNYEKIKDNTTPIDLKWLVCHQSFMALCS